MSESSIFNYKEDCSCLEGNFYYLNFETTPLRKDARTGEVDLLACKTCGRQWLFLLHDPAIRDDDSRWYAGLINDASIPAISQGDVLNNVLAHFETLDWYYVGGVYWSAIGTRVPFKTHGKISLWP